MSHKETWEHAQEGQSGQQTEMEAWFSDWFSLLIGFSLLLNTFPGGF